MPSNESRERLVLTMEGLPSQGGDIPVSAFVSVVQGLQMLMRKVAERQTGKKGGGMEFLISNLSHSSPASVEIVPGGDSAIAGKVVADTEYSLLLVAKGQTADIYAPEYNAIKKIVTPCEKGAMTMATICRANGSAKPAHKPVVVDKKFIRNFVHGREGEMRGITTVSGMVEKLDMHALPIKLTIYPKIGIPVVWCLPDNAMGTALDAIGKRVMVNGDACFRPDADNPGIHRPYRIYAGADNAEILKPGKENWRKIQELRGKGALV